MIVYNASDGFILKNGTFRVELFRYLSARDKNKGKNLALFTPKAFCQNKPTKYMPWLCHTTQKEVGFLSKESHQRILFRQADFLVDEYFPAPAV